MTHTHSSNLICLLGGFLETKIMISVY